MKVHYAIHYHTSNGYDGSDLPEDKQEFEDKMSFRKSEGWESIGHISRDGLHVEILYMEVRN